MMIQLVAVLSTLARLRENGGAEQQDDSARNADKTRTNQEILVTKDRLTSSSVSSPIQEEMEAEETRLQDDDEVAGSEDQDDDLAGLEEQGDGGVNHQDYIQETKAQIPIHRHLRRPTETFNNSNSLKDVPVSWIHYFVVLAVAFQSVMNGFVFGTGSLLMFEEYELSKSLIGILYSISAATGFFASFVTLTKPVLDQMKIWFPSPNNFYTFLLGTTTMVGLTAVPVFYVYIVGYSLMNIFLDVFVSFLAERQGKISTAEHYQKLAPTGQIVRRVFGVAINLSVPVPLWCDAFAAQYHRSGHSCGIRVGHRHQL